MADLKNLFNIGKKVKFTDILYKLSNPDNINFSTDLRIEQIGILVQHRFFDLRNKEKMKPLHYQEDPNDTFDKCIEEYKHLLVSKDRLSREEITSTIKRSPMVDEEAIRDRIKEQVQLMK